MCSANKGADKLTAKLICAFVVAYANCCFSGAVAHILCLFYFRMRSVLGQRS